MNCHAAHELIQQSLDGAPIDSPEWHDHLRHCTECASLVRAARRMQDGLRLLTAPLPPPTLAAQIADRVLRDLRRARRRARQRWAITLALAASLFIALILRMDWHGRTTDKESEQAASVATKTNMDNGEPARSNAPTLRESAAELKDVFASLTNQTADETVEQTRRFAAKVPSPSFPSVELKAMEPPTNPLREAGEGVSEGLEPVTNSARRAVGLFLRELPPMEEGQKGL